MFGQNDSRQKSLAQTVRRDVKYSEILELIEVVQKNGTGPLQRAVQDLLERLFEVSVLHDEKIQRIGRHWSALGLKAVPALKVRLGEIVEKSPNEIPQEMVAHVQKILTGTAFRLGRRQGKHGDYFQKLIAEQSKKSKRRPRTLWCCNCGYQFRKADMGTERQELAAEQGFEFSKGSDPRRTTDPWKPLIIPGRGEAKTRHLTALELDHVTPEEGLGWSDVDNLEILCALCNGGKQAYKYALEPLSLFAAGGLADLPKDRGWSAIKQTVVSFTFAFHQRRCAECGLESADTELTVQERGIDTASSSQSFAPWNLICLCYRCRSKTNYLSR